MTFYYKCERQIFLWAYSIYISLISELKDFSHFLVFILNYSFIFNKTCLRNLSDVWRTSVQILSYQLQYRQGFLIHFQVSV